MSVWVEDVTKSGFKVCMRELKSFSGIHTQVKVVCIEQISFRFHGTIVPRNIESLPYTQFIQYRNTQNGKVIPRRTKSKRLSSIIFFIEDFRKKKNTNFEKDCQS